MGLSSGRNAFIWTPERQDPVELEHSSTVGGLAFDVNGKRLAVSHYGGGQFGSKRNIVGESQNCFGRVLMVP